MGGALRGWVGQRAEPRAEVRTSGEQHPARQRPRSRPGACGARSLRNKWEKQLEHMPTVEKHNFIYESQNIVLNILLISHN